jgi:hypothetical protein
MSLALYLLRVRSGDLLGIALGWILARRSSGFAVFVPLRVLVGVQIGVLTYQRPEGIHRGAHRLAKRSTQLFLLCDVLNGFDNLNDLIELSVKLGERCSKFFSRRSVHGDYREI